VVDVLLSDLALLQAVDFGREIDDRPLGPFKILKKHGIVDNAIREFIQE
jgi:hypothetical protein